MTKNEFIDKYSKLNDVHKHIVMETLRRMDHRKSHLKINDLIHDKIEKEMKIKKIGYLQLFSLIDNQMNYDFSQKTYESFMKRKSINSHLIPIICEILNISSEELNSLRYDILVQAEDSIDIKWLYESLSTRDMHAMYYLVSALYMNEHHPEIFSLDVPIE